MLLPPFVFQKPDDEREELGEFLYQYLQRRFGVENMIIEWGYNLYDACARYSHDARIGLFYGILQKEVTRFLSNSRIPYNYELADCQESIYRFVVVVHVISALHTMSSGLSE